MVSFLLELHIFFLDELVQVYALQHHGYHAASSHERFLDHLDALFGDELTFLNFEELLALLFVIPSPKPPRTTFVLRWFLERRWVFHPPLGCE